MNYDNSCEKTHTKRMHIASRYSATSDESRYFSRNLRKGLIAIINYRITSQSCILCAAETLKQVHCGKRCRSSILVLMAAILAEDIIRNIYVKLFV